jgi:hypothetical protein
MLGPRLKFDSFVAYFLRDTVLRTPEFRYIAG